MNYTSPLILSVFIHLGIGLSFSNFFNIDFDIFNIESAKPISAYVIFEKETEPKKEKIRIPKKNKGAEPDKNDIKTIAISSPDLVIDKLQQLSSTEAYLPKERRNKFSQSDIEKYSFLIKNKSLITGKDPKALILNLRLRFKLIWFLQEKYSQQRLLKAVAIRFLMILHWLRSLGLIILKV